MKGLTPAEYACLQGIERLATTGWLLEDVRPGSDASRLVARGALALQIWSGCPRGDCKGWLPTPSGRLAMRCYELEHRSLDLGIAS